MDVSRRSFLTVGALGAMGTLSAGAASEAAGADFSFVHFTDVHIQPELRADVGSRACMARINALQS